MPVSGTVVVTGATGGLGKAVTTELARRGAPVIMVARNLGRAEAARLDILGEVADANIELAVADLGSLDDVRRLAHDLRDRPAPISGLVHTAAIYTGSRRLTIDGLESMFAVNHLAPYLLTRLMLRGLGQAAPARVLLVTAPSTTVPDFDDLQGGKQFRPLRAFSASKMGNLLFAAGLARRVDPARITVNALHPGLMKSDLMGDLSNPMRFLLNLVSRSPQRPARAIGAIVSGERSTPNGAFLVLDKVKKPPRGSDRLDLQDRLWRVSSELAGLSGD